MDICCGADSGVGGLMPDESRVPSIDTCQPLFQQFCHERGLQEGETWRTVDYILWCHPREEADDGETPLA